MTSGIAVATVGRSDFGILSPLVQHLVAAEDFEVGLWVTGAHFDEASGSTITEVRKSGLPIWAEVSTAIPSNDADGALTVMGEIISCAHIFIASERPDLVVILGDRYEAVALGLACTVLGLPIAHISGGSITEGAFDDVFRHCLTQMAEIHFCDTYRFGQRINQLGANPESINVVGALGLDGPASRRSVSWDALSGDIDGCSLGGPGYWLATFHPETMAPGSSRELVDVSIRALEKSRVAVLYTYPNADPESNIIRKAIDEACNRNTNHVAVPNLGAARYYAALEHADGVIGNSSSGIIEAASFKLPVVNIGNRQKGRFCGENVLHANITEDSVLAALGQARSAEMARLLASFENPYGDGFAAPRIVSALRKHLSESRSPLRIFSDYEPAKVRDMIATQTRAKP